MTSRPPELAALDELYRQWRGGELTTAAYHIAFRLIDAQHSHDTPCANGCAQLAVVIINRRALCGRCDIHAQEAGT
jgi:hypothetical protein